MKREDVSKIFENATDEQITKLLDMFCSTAPAYRICGGIFNFF